MPGRKLGLKSNIPMFKTFIPANDNGPLIMIIFTKLVSLLSLSVCHRTYACPAYNVLGDHSVVFKDSWHADATNIILKGYIYADLNWNGVHFIPVCFASVNVECWDELKTQQIGYTGSLNHSVFVRQDCRLHTILITNLS